MCKKLAFCVNVYHFISSALVKLLNKSIEGTADDDDEGVTPDTAIRSGLELLKVQDMEKAQRFSVSDSDCRDFNHSDVNKKNHSMLFDADDNLYLLSKYCLLYFRSCHLHTPRPSTPQRHTSLCFSV